MRTAIARVLFREMLLEKRTARAAPACERNSARVRLGSRASSNGSLPLFRHSRDLESTRQGRYAPSDTETTDLSPVQIRPPNVTTASPATPAINPFKYPVRLFAVG
jgi:hypothetical protein